MLLRSERIVRKNLTRIKREKNSDVAVLSKSTDTQEIKFKMRNKEKRMKCKSIRDINNSRERESDIDISSIRKSNRSVLDMFRVSEQRRIRANMTASSCVNYPSILQELRLVWIPAESKRKGLDEVTDGA